VIRTILQFALLTLAAAGLSVAADQPDFSGNWKMDSAKSDFGGAPPPDSFTRKIEQAGSSLILTDQQTSAQGDDKAVRKYSTDGKETTYHWMGNDVKSAAHWDGNTIVIVGKVDASGTEIVVNSRLSLSADGKTLTEDDKLAAGGNEIAAFTIVLVKQ
jgi:hypothetical protein